MEFIVSSTQWIHRWGRLQGVSNDSRPANPGAPPLCQSLTWACLCKLPSSSGRLSFWWQNGYQQVPGAARFFLGNRGDSLSSNCWNKFLGFPLIWPIWVTCQLESWTNNRLGMGQSPLYFRGNGTTAKEEPATSLHSHSSQTLTCLKPPMASQGKENKIKCS